MPHQMGTIPINGPARSPLAPSLVTAAPATNRLIVTTHAPLPEHAPLQFANVELALAVGVFSGFVFGLYPAIRATRLDPIEALRYE